VAGDWLKVEAVTPDKPEVFEIATQLNMSPTDAFGRLFLVWRWFDQHTKDGNAASVTPAYIDHVAGVSGFANAMKTVRWLLGGDDGKPGVSLPHFDYHNGKTAKSRALTAKRVATHKQRSGNGEVTQTALPREEKRRSKTNSASAFALPDWVPEKTWTDFEESRRKLRKPMTDRARTLVLKELATLRDAGHDPSAVLDQSIRRGWLDVFPLKDGIAKSADFRGVV
jgi:hypothetical protein